MIYIVKQELPIKNYKKQMFIGDVELKDLLIGESRIKLHIHHFQMNSELINLKFNCGIRI